MINLLLRTPLINDILNKFIKKKTGYDLEVNISTFDLKDSEKTIHLSFEVDLNKNNTFKAISEMFEKGK